MGAEELVQHQFGRFVAEAVLEHGSEEQRQLLVAVLRQRILELAQHRGLRRVSGVRVYRS